MVIERALVRLLHTQALRASSSSAVIQRGVVGVQQVWKYVASMPASDGFFRTEMSDSFIGTKSPVWQGWTRGFTSGGIWGGCCSVHGGIYRRWLSDRNSKALLLTCVAMLLERLKRF